MFFVIRGASCHFLMDHYFLNHSLVFQFDILQYISSQLSFLCCFKIFFFLFLLVLMSPSIFFFSVFLLLFPLVFLFLQGFQFFRSVTLHFSSNRLGLSFTFTGLGITLIILAVL